MTETGWQAIGRIAKKRRERLGLKQEDLVRYGGPAVSTVGKFERAAQDGFPLRTQHQMETALGWSRTIVEQVVKSIDTGELTVEDWEYDLVEEHIPDLGRPLDEDDVLPERRIDPLRSLFALIPEEHRDNALRAVVAALADFIRYDYQGPYERRLSDQADKPDLALAADPGDDAAGETESYHET